MDSKDQFSNGDRYKIVPRVLIFLFNDTDKVLLLRGSEQKKLWKNLYNGIGGHVEKGETILESAQRELREETGLFCESLHYCGMITVDTGSDLGVGLHIFCGTKIEGKIVASSEGELSWVNINDLDPNLMMPDLRILLDKVRKALLENTFIFGLYKYDAQDKLQMRFDEIFR